MQNKYIELKQRRDLGGIISTYFDFFKYNLKSFTNIFISYNGIFIFLLLGVSYLLVTGFIGMANASSGLSNTTEDESLMYIGFGFLLFFVIFIAVAALNYSLASAYLITYNKERKIITDKKQVWAVVNKNIGKIIVFILLLVVIYIGVSIVNMIIGIIPLIGFFANLIVGFAVTAWFGVSFMVMLNENKNASNAFGEGWNLVVGSFWKSVLVNLVLGFLVGILLLQFMLVPGILIGVYSFHLVDTNINIGESAVAKIIYIISTCIFLVIFTYSQSLSQFINGILYFSLHEGKYNIYTQERINQIGSGD
ncbi:hypothetical protein GCM10022393_29900 [Aquimarina addita]|uniref:Glycerophosphoryl diester phosphodiesterase membrane domain-containing protein n=1 Tax=Aquimarina addita TaxID=870485 RepID=A0ABP6UPI8_9FLAO